MIVGDSRIRFFLFPTVADDGAGHPVRDLVELCIIQFLISGLYGEAVGILFDHLLESGGD
jgi:hypothetical protein